MPSAIYCRMLVQVGAVMLHSINAIDMYIAMQNQELMKDPKIKSMTSLQSHYLTVWNIGFQLAYFALAFSCDYMALKDRYHMSPRRLGNLREILFAAIVWPTTMIIFIIFWPVFITDRELLYPKFIDKIFSFKSNFVMHFWIFPLALFEQCLWGRRIPTSHSKNLKISTALLVVYMTILCRTYFQHGLWPYPIMKLTYGTIYFPILLIAFYVLWIICYFAQWKLMLKDNDITKKKNS